MVESFISYSVDNDNRFRDALKKASEVVQDFRIPFGLILNDFYKSEQAIFSLKSPGRYPPFTHSKEEFKVNSVGSQRRKAGAISNAKPGDFSAYQWWKLRHLGFDYPLLVKTGALAASLTGPNNKGSIAKPTKLSLIFGTSIPYGIHHEYGAPKRNLPMRKFMFIGPEGNTKDDGTGRLKRWLGYIEDAVTRETNKAVGRG